MLGRSDKKYHQNTVWPKDEPTNRLTELPIKYTTHIEMEKEEERETKLVSWKQEMIENRLEK